MFSEQHAKRAIQFIESLKHTKGKWRGVNFELLDWQKQIVSDVFGTIKPDGYRQFSTAYVEVPKKNGKSELAAAIALKLLCADGEWGAEVYGCAADRQQASIVFDVAVEMVDQNRELRKHIKPILSSKRLLYKPTRSFYQVLSAEAFTKHGLNVSGVVFDEIHAQPNRQLYDVMTQGSGDARTQPLFFIITTAGDDPDRTSIGWEVHEYAERVKKGLVKDPSFYSVIYGIDENADPWDEKNWYKSNPSLGHTIDIEKVRTAVIKAKETPAIERTFRQLRLNQWINYKNTDWVSLEAWDATAGIVDPEKLKGRSCYGGLDLSSKVDTTALVLVFEPTENDPQYRVVPYTWIPEDGLDKRVKRDKIPYDQWKREGFLKATPGNVVDYAIIEKDIKALYKKFDIKEIGYDRWGAYTLTQALASAGITMVEMAQGPQTFSPAMKELQKMILGKEIEHGGHPVLRWAFGNVQVSQDANENIRPVKVKGAKRIDPVVAMIMGVGRAILHKKKTSVYETRGVRTL